VSYWAGVALAAVIVIGICAVGFFALVL